MATYLDLPTRDLTIFLLKASVSMDVVAKHLDDVPAYLIKMGASTGRLYVQQDQRPPLPPWVELFEGQLPAKELGEVASLSAALVVEASGRVFVLTFGSGRFLLDQEWPEDRFGYFAVLNLVDAGLIRSVDKQTLDGLGRQTRVQVSRSARLPEFGVDYERDLLRAVVGKPGDPKLGTIVTGTSSLRTKVHTDLARLPKLLRQYLERSEHQGYLKKFPGISELKVIRDEQEAASLNGEVVRRLNEGEWDGCSLAIPEIVDWQSISGFRYQGVGDTLDHNELDLKDLMGLVAADGEPLALADLRRIYVQTVDGDGMPSGGWSLGRSLFAEIVIKSRTFVLSAGVWYEVAKGLVEDVNAAFVELGRLKPQLPAFADVTEEKYCQRVCAAPGAWTVMDRKPVQYGGGKSSVEFCDMFNLESKTLLHVKRYAGSAPLSHLFQQALVSGEVFKTRSDFRELVNKKLPVSHRIHDCSVDPDGFRVALGIVKPKVLSLPFFSKVTLRNTARLLKGFGFTVLLAHIDVSPDWAVTKKARKPKKTP